MHFDYCLLGAISGRELTLEDLQTLDTPVNLLILPHAHELRLC